MSVATVTLLSGGALIPNYELMSVDIRREVNRIPRATLVLHDGDAARQEFALSDHGEFRPGKEIEIKVRWESEPSSRDTTLFKGPIVRQAIEADAGGSLLRVEVKDKSVKLAQTRKSTVFRDQKDDEVIKSLISSAGLATGAIDAGAFTHPELVQYYCSDWDFILSRADANGLLVVAEDGTFSARKVNLAGPEKKTFTYGIDELYDFEFEADAVHQYPSVTSSGWSIKDQKAVTSKAAPVTIPQGDVDGKKLAETVGFKEYTLSHPVPIAVAELKAWADARLLRSRLSLLRGRLGTRGFADIKLLDLIALDKLGKGFSGKALVTGIAHRVDADGWRTDLQFGLSSRAFSLEDDIRDAPAAGLLPGVGGLQLGLVDDFAEDPDKQLRVKVILPGLASGAGSVWARLATPDAGKDRGFFFRPEIGDEVVVGFFNDDPRQPVILGSLYSEKNGAPSAFAELEKDNLAKGIVTKRGTTIGFTDDEKAALFLETAAHNKILVDDDKEMIQITDQHGNKVTLDKDGITLVSAKDLKLEASGNVEIKGSKVDIK